MFYTYYFPAKGLLQVISALYTSDNIDNIYKTDFEGLLRNLNDIFVRA